MADPRMETPEVIGDAQLDVGKARGDPRPPGRVVILSSKD